MFSPRIGNRKLAEVCYRMGTALDAGIDIRRSLEREVERNDGITRRNMATIRDRVAGGASLSDAMGATGSFFPRLVLAIVRVGETTGHLDQVLLKLADYYHHLVQGRRQLLRAIAWPVTELVLALAIVAILILLPLALPSLPGGQRQDLLGWGWVGYSGIVKYLLLLFAIGAALVALVHGFRRENSVARWLLAIWERLPFVGTPLTDLAMGRLAWSLSLTTNTAMPLQESLALALDASCLPRLTRLIPQVQHDITQGDPLHQTLRRTGQLPADFLDVVEVGEETGNLPEALGRLSANLEDRSKEAIQRLSMIAGAVVWIGVAFLIISLVFHLYGNYLRTLEGFL